MYRILLLTGLFLYGKATFPRPVLSDDKGLLVASTLRLDSFLCTALGLLIVIVAIFAMTWTGRRLDTIVKVQQNLLERGGYPRYPGDRRILGGTRWLQSRA